MIVNDLAANAYALDNLARLDAGAGPSVIKYYTAPKPAGPNTAITSQTLLASTVCSDPSGVVGGRTLTLSAISDDVAVDVAGTVAWARHETFDGVAVNDYTVTVTGGGGEMTFNLLAWAAGAVVKITAGAISF